MYKPKHKSIELHYISFREGIQSSGESFHDYNASNGDYYASREAMPAIFEILSGLVTYKSRPCEGKLKHRSIALP